jgi:DNA polymerase-3 subunit gamma/tau
MPKPVLEPNWAEKWRPKLFKEMAGQEQAVSIVQGMFKTGKIPQTILIFGDSGVAKSTLARLIARRLSPQGMDIFESNAAEDTGIEKMRGLIDSARTLSMHGDFKIFIVDEIHGLTKNAGSAALSFLEKPPAHVIVIGTTNEEERMLSTLRDRATVIRLKPLNSEAIYKILVRIAEGEGVFQPTADHEPLFKTLSQIFTGSARPAIDALYQLSLIHATRPIKKEDIVNEVNRSLQFDFKDTARFVNHWYNGRGEAAMKIMDSVEDPALFVSMLCKIHAYILRKRIGLNPTFDYLGVAAAKGLPSLNPNLLRDNLELLLNLRSDLLSPIGRDTGHLLLVGMMKLKDK